MIPENWQQKGDGSKTTPRGFGIKNGFTFSVSGASIPPFDLLLHAVVAMLAECLMVALLPEHSRVAVVRFDVVNHGRRDGQTLLFAENAKRVGLQELQAEKPPLVAVQVYCDLLDSGSDVFWVSADFRGGPEFDFPHVES